MRFSEFFKLGNVNKEEWFDPLLTLDTHLFIDPFLIYDNEQGEFEGSHKEIISFFEYVFQLIAKSGGNNQSTYWDRAHRLVRFPEVQELCLGYTGDGTGGAGSAGETAGSIASSIWAAINHGVESLRHFEEIQIFGEGIGPDRISDATAGMIRHRLARYTAGIANKYGLATARVSYDRAQFNLTDGRWTNGEFFLPINPYNGRPILLVPKRYLRPLPTINPDDFWKYCYNTNFGLLRKMFGEDITSHVNKKTIIDLARSQPDLRDEYIKRKEAQGREPYDFDSDPEGQFKWYGATQAWVASHPRALSFTSSTEFKEFVSTIIQEFEISWKIMADGNSSGTRTKPLKERARRSYYF